MYTANLMCDNASQQMYKCKHRVHLYFPVFT